MSYEWRGNRCSLYSASPYKRISVPFWEILQFLSFQVHRSLCQQTIIPPFLMQCSRHGIGSSLNFVMMEWKFSASPLPLQPSDLHETRTLVKNMGRGGRICCRKEEHIKMPIQSGSNPKCMTHTFGIQIGHLRTHSIAVPCVATANIFY